MTAIQATARGSGIYRVFANDVLVSEHTAEREALENATEVLAGEPTARVYYTHDYVVDVALAESAEPPSPPPPSSGAPDVTERFQYATAVDLMASAKYTRNEDANLARIFLTDGAMEYRYPDATAWSNRCSDYTIGRNIALPRQVREVAFRSVLSFRDWQIAPSWASTCTSNIDFKLFFGRMTVDGPASRFDVRFGNGGAGEIVVGYPGNIAAFRSGRMVTRYLDALPHEFLLYMRQGAADGAVRLVIDGETIVDKAGLACYGGDQNRIWSLALGRNRNQGAGQEQSMFVHEWDVWLEGNSPDGI